MRPLFHIHQLLCQSPTLAWCCVKIRLTVFTEATSLVAFCQANLTPWIPPWLCRLGDLNCCQPSSKLYINVIIMCMP